MKKIIHIVYLAIIVLLSVLFVLKRTNCKKEYINSALSQTYAETPKLHWTYGINYDSLIPINELVEQDPELKRFLKELNTVFRKKDWMKIIEISNKEHYQKQGSFLGDDTLYVYNNISIYPHWERGVVVTNSLGNENDNEGGFDKLNQIKSLKLVGRKPEKSYGKTYDYYGYVEKNNGVILAVYFSITKRSGKYELTGGVG